MIERLLLLSPALAADADLDALFDAKASVQAQLAKLSATL